MDVAGLRERLLSPPHSQDNVQGTVHAAAEGPGTAPPYPPPCLLTSESIN